MTRLPAAFTLIFLLFAIPSCQKDEKIDHQNLVVDGNKPPPYDGIPEILVENYVSKMNIDLIGLKPDDITRETRTEYLKNNDLSMDAREKVIDDILVEDAYHDRLFQVNSDLLLNGMGYDEIQTVYTDYSFVRDFFYQTGDTFTGQYFDNELMKLQLVLDSKEDYKDGKIDMGEYFSRMSFNLIYDEINMGSENFVIACFENFFKRKPSVKELESGVTMVDGQPTQILLQSGRTKIDFLNIMVSNSEFYQGRVLDAYLSLLLREPETKELSELSQEYENKNDFNIVQKSIAKTDEYAGFE